MVTLYVPKVQLKFITARLPVIRMATLVRPVDQVQQGGPIESDPVPVEVQF